MNRIPRLPNSLGDMMRWARDVNDFLMEIDPGTGAPNTLTSRTTRGFQRSAIGGGEEGEAGAPLQFKGDWDANITYAKDDIVIRRTITPNVTNDFDRAVEGTYLATLAVSPGDVPPGETEGVGAVLTPHINGGKITSIDVAGGTGYPFNAYVAINGDGGGATAHATITDGVPTSIIVDKGGALYTFAVCELKNGPVHWDDFAQFRTKKWTLLSGKQRITIDVGRDNPNDLKITIEKDKTVTDGSSPRIRLDMAQLLSVAGSGNYDICFHEWEVCIGNVAQHAIFLSSAPY